MTTTDFDAGPSWLLPFNDFVNEGPAFQEARRALLDHARYVGTGQYLIMASVSLGTGLVSLSLRLVH